MPIKGLSEQVRIPRLGKIHLGYKDEKKKGAPTATDYFVCPPEVVAVYGDKPTSLPIMIPVEDEDIWASQYYRAYSNTRGLTCRGDGETCRRMVDTKTGDMANRDTEKVAWREGDCAGRECPDYQAKKCSEKMCLQFMLPEVPGIGVWQIDTGSINSIRNINSAAVMIMNLCGRVRMIPLVLTLGKQEVVNPDDGKKKMVNVLSLTHGQSLHNLLSDSIKPVHELLAPLPVEDEAPLDVEIETISVTPTPETKQPEPDLTQAEKDISELWESQEGKATDTAGEDTSAVDLVWLHETLIAIHWTEKTALNWIKSQCHVKGEKLVDVCNEMPTESLKKFTEHIRLMRKAS